MDIEKTEKALNMSKRTLMKNIRKLSKLECEVLRIENSKNGVVYKMKYGEVAEENNVLSNSYVTIHNKMLKEMINELDNNTIKLYCILCHIANTETFTPITNVWICKQIGLSPNSETNLDVITKISRILEKHKYIEIKKTTQIFWDSSRNRDITKTSKSYRLCTFKEWESRYRV